MAILKLSGSGGRISPGLRGSLPVIQKTQQIFHWHHIRLSLTRPAPTPMAAFTLWAAPLVLTCRVPSHAPSCQRRRYGPKLQRVQHCVADPRMSEGPSPAAHL